MNKKQPVMKKVAIPVVNGKLGENLDQCTCCIIFEIDGKDIRGAMIRIPPHQHRQKLPEWASEQGITDIIANHASQELIRRLTSEKVHCFVGIHIQPPEEIMEKFLNGHLKPDPDEL